MIKDVEFVQTKGIKMWGDANPSYLPAIAS